MVEAKKFYRTLKKYGFGPFTGIPCSLVKPLLNYLIRGNKCEYTFATSEGEAMGIAAGSALCGHLPVVITQNSGLGNTIDPLTSLNLVYDLPVLLLITLRGEPNKPDQPQHRVMGCVTDKFLAVLGIYYEYLAETDRNTEAQIKRIRNIITKKNKPAAIIVRKGDIRGDESEFPEKIDRKVKMKRKEAISCIMENLKGNEMVVSSTGKISRELYFNDQERKNNFYMFGSMGCAASIGFALARERPDKKVIILDGDGAILMKMGTLATIGHYQPKNLIHIVLDNNCHDSTGGQPTVSDTVFLEKIAKNCGYATTVKIYEPKRLVRTLKYVLATQGPHFIVLKILRGAEKDLGRPELAPSKIKERFMKSISKK